MRSKTFLTSLAFPKCWSRFAYSSEKGSSAGASASSLASYFRRFQKQAQNFGHLLGRVVIEMNEFTKARFQPGVTVEKLSHQIGLTSNDHD